MQLKSQKDKCMLWSFTESKLARVKVGLNVSATTIKVSLRYFSDCGSNKEAIGRSIMVNYPKAISPGVSILEVG